MLLYEMLYMLSAYQAISCQYTLPTLGNVRADKGGDTPKHSIDKFTLIFFGRVLPVMIVKTHPPYKNLCNPQL